MAAIIQNKHTIIFNIFTKHDNFQKVDSITALASKKYIIREIAK
jgi:hypothetical protein